MIDLNDLITASQLPSSPTYADSKRIEKIKKLRGKVIKAVSKMVYDNKPICEHDITIDIYDLFIKWEFLESYPWLNNKCVIGLMGGFSAGKSTLMNRLLECDINKPRFSLPTGNSPTSSILTYIAKSEKEDFCIVNKSGEVKTIPYDMVEFLSYYQDALHSEYEKENNIRNILKQLLNIDYNVLLTRSQLLDKISFLDTPGINSTNKNDCSVTTAAAGKCNIVLWLINAHNGEIHDDEIKFIDNNLKSKSLYIVITRAEEIFDIESVKNKILQTLDTRRIGYKGVYYLGLENTDEINIDQEIKKLKEALNGESIDVELQNPNTTIFKKIQEIIDKLTVYIDNTITERHQLTELCVKYEKEIRDLKYDLDSELSDLSYATDKVTDIINNRCSTVRFCGETYVLLDKEKDNLKSSHIKLVQAASRIDHSKIIKYGEKSKDLEKVTLVYNTLVNYKNELNELIRDELLTTPRKMNTDKDNTSTDESDDEYDSLPDTLKGIFSNIKF